MATPVFAGGCRRRLRLVVALAVDYCQPIKRICLSEKKNIAAMLPLMLVRIALALFTAIFLIRFLGRRGELHEPLTASPAPAAAPEEGDDAYHEKLRRQLEEWD